MQVQATILEIMQVQATTQEMMLVQATILLEQAAIVPNVKIQTQEIQQATAVETTLETMQKTTINIF